MAERKIYDSKLDQLFQDILKMGVKVKESLIKAEKAFDEGDSELASQVIEDDKFINENEVRLEDRVIELIALHHPVAHDLRKMVAALKIIAHLERLGDHGVHIAKAVITPQIRIPQKYILHFNVMLDNVIKMLDKALTAFLDDDSDLAVEVSRYDNIIDKEYDDILEDLFKEQPQEVSVPVISSIMVLARYLERSGDHIIHICEWIVYASKSEHMELNQ